MFFPGEVTLLIPRSDASCSSGKSLRYQVRGRSGPVSRYHWVKTVRFIRAVHHTDTAHKKQKAAAKQLLFSWLCLCAYPGHCGAICGLIFSLQGLQELWIERDMQRSLGLSAVVLILIKCLNEAAAHAHVCCFTSRHPRVCFTQWPHWLVFLPAVTRQQLWAEGAPVDSLVSRGRCVTHSLWLWTAHFSLK